LVDSWVTNQNQLGVFYLFIALLSCCVLALSQFRKVPKGTIQAETST
jgi:hypothetical protein